MRYEKLTDSLSTVHVVADIRSDIRRFGLWLRAALCLSTPVYTLAAEMSVSALEPGSEAPKWDVRHALFDAKRWREAAGSESTAEFYAKQDEAVAAFNAIETLRSGGVLVDEAQDDAEAAAEERAISISFVSNVLLFCAKLVAAVMTGSMVVLVSTLDSALDLLSGGILFITALVAKKPNPMSYPLGKAKMEPLGIVVFSALMGMSALMVAVESVKALLSSQCEEEVGQAAATSPGGANSTDSGSLSAAEEGRCLPESYTADIALTTASILAGVVLVKTLLFLYCRIVQKMRGSASVAAYADDHFNDALSNAVSVAVFGVAQFYCPDGRVDTPDGSSVCPDVILWWLDPLAALLLSLMIFSNWVDSGREQLLLLVGHIAPTILLQQLTCVHMFLRATARQFHIYHCNAREHAWLEADYHLRT